MADLVLNGVVQVCDHYAAIKNGKVIGVVQRFNETQWGWYPLDGISLEFVPVRFAVEAANKEIFE